MSLGARSGQSCVLCRTIIMFIIINILLCTIVLVSAVEIITGVTSTGDPYMCLANDTPCPTVGFGGQDSIDPRIVTPNDLCPPGHFPCYAIKTECGVRVVETINQKDGYADKGAHPWQAFLRNSTHSFSGSGALLDSFHVLTAAHKVDGNKENPGDITVLMGVWDPHNLDNTQSSRVEEVSVHPSFNEQTLINDIAILRLENPVVFGVQNNINTICKPNSEATFVGSNCMVSGWGQSSFTVFDAPTTPQKQVAVTVVDPPTCRESFARPNLLGGYVDVYLDQVGEVCAGGEAQRDACTQDGGSPLACPDSNGKLHVAGLVIWGKNCGQPGVYGVYVNVPYYSQWIDMTIESLNAKYGGKN